MKRNYLFPNGYKKAGWLLFVPSFLLAILALSGVLPDDQMTTKLPPFVYSTGVFGSEQTNDWMNEIYLVGLALSLLFIGFSREKDEDELISEIRLSAIAFAAKASTVILIVGTLLIYGFAYLTFMWIYLFLMMLLFIGKYQYELWKFRKDNKEVQL
ncbi:MAG: hypothetical protein PUK66_02265 [Bacteroidales bacterium]|uniref:hypothetical protein n=1 Tax=Porphyromonas sp. TaxID=1924944 RepID=UPI00297581F3|nr:hypothetical protein [Porphyromonas sp.]MDD7437654.1 hypothetical protein [Bacteroidales bacterium]MDY3066396.1 hypothetical protein [Porphyromonas sp.]